VQREMWQTGLEKNRRTLVRDYKMVQVENMSVPFSTKFSCADVVNFYVWFLYKL
jgi:hypothetical protein